MVRWRADRPPEPALRFRDLDAAAVHDDAAQTVAAHQLLVVLQLDPGLADDAARLELLEPARLELAVRDLAHVPERMGQAHAQRIRPERHHVDAGFRLLQAARFDGGDVLVARVRLDHDRAEARPLRVEALAHFRGVERDEPGEPLQGAPEAVLPLRGHHDVEGRAVLGQDPALAVEEGSARSGDGQGADAVVLGEVAEVFPADDLQVPEVDEQAGHGQGDEELHDAHAPLDRAQVLVDPHARGAQRRICRSIVSKTTIPTAPFTSARTMSPTGLSS